MALVVASQEVGVEQMLFSLISANMNATTDQSFRKLGDWGSYLITRIRCWNASTNLDTAAGGIYTAASKGGNAIVANSQAYTALDASTKGLDLTIAAIGLGGQTVNPPILSLTTAQGAAATANFAIFGVILPPGHGA